MKIKSIIAICLVLGLNSAALYQKLSEGDSDVSFEIDCTGEENITVKHVRVVHLIEQEFKQTKETTLFQF